MKTKAQSALEYMMTYGWAILIIVIVAAVLYSMGIFNPSAASGNTSSGFGGFSVTSYSCSQSKGFNVTLGNNLGNTIKVWSVSGTTPVVLASSGMNSGFASANLNVAGVTAPGSKTVVAGGVFTVTDVPATGCGTAGGKYSVELNYVYTLNGLNYTTQGTVQGTVAS